MKVNKYLYGWKLYVNYGQGWEYETFEETWASYRENRKAYRENCDYPQRWSRGRELNPEWEALNANPIIALVAPMSHSFMIDPAYTGTARDYCSVCGRDKGSHV